LAYKKGGNPRQSLGLGKGLNLWIFVIIPKGGFGAVTQTEGYSKTQRVLERVKPKK